MKSPDMNPTAIHRRKAAWQLITGKSPTSGFFTASVIRNVIAPCLSVLWVFCPSVNAAAPDLTKVELSTIDRNLTYNLGPTGLRGWIYNSEGSGQEGTISALSRQILVTVVGDSTPAAGVLAVNDVILGVGWGTASDPVPLFTSDARKSFGGAIGEAEKTANNGLLRIKRWRAGVATDVSITLSTLGAYTDTAPYNCPKSTLILTKARDLLVSQLLADPKFLNADYGGAIKGLALLASVEPWHPNYAAVQGRLRSLARSIAAVELRPQGLYIWSWGYMGVFLSEYYLRTVADGTPDASVLPGINQITVALAKNQSRYGTYGHGGAGLKPDGSLHGTIAPYGPVNSAGLPANIAIVMGKKAIQAGRGTLHPEINPAIMRASNFFSYFVNKGPIPYGEHEPYMAGHASNGKDAMCAVLFGLQDQRPVQNEYFTRMSTAGYNGREYGHSGQGFSYLWGALGANMGGPAAAAAYLQQVRWHLDLERRTDGSFVYDGGEQYGAGKTADNSYLGACGYNDVNPTASYILTYALPLARIHLTGKNRNPASTLDAAKVANAIAAGSFKQTCTAFTTPQLIAALAEYDPVARNYAVTELATRALSEAEVNRLITLAEGDNVNQRQGACETLGFLKAPGALPALGRRISDPDMWVRAKAAKALTSYGALASTQLTPMLTAVKANATNPDAIDWHDPVQISNGFLAEALFTNGLAAATIAAPRNQLYPAVKVGLKQPDSHARCYMNDFITGRLTQADVVALLPDICQVVSSVAQADTMWHAYPRAAGITTLAKYNMRAGIQLALKLLVVPEGYGWGCDKFIIPGLHALASYGGEARATLPALKKYLTTWKPESSEYKTLVETIAAIEKPAAQPHQGKP